MKLEELRDVFPQYVKGGKYYVDVKNPKTGTVRWYTDEEWLKHSCARYAVGIGWHIVSTDTFPEDAPKHLILGWDEFRNGDDRHMKKPAAILDKKAKNKEWINA